MDKNIEIWDGSDLVRLFREYPTFLEVFVEDQKGNLLKIKSIRWEGGGPASWLVLATTKLEKNG